MPTSLSSKASRNVRGNARVTTRSGKRFILAFDRPLEALITSSATSARTPAFSSATSPSAVPQMCIASSALLTALSASPVPITPQCTMRVPKWASTGRTRSSTASSPPTITVSAAFSAPTTPPDTGASMKAMPCSASRAAMRREVAESPDVQSTRTDPRAIVASSPVGPSSSDSTSRETGKQVITTSRPAAASAGVCATRAVRSAANACTNASAFAAVRFQTTRS